MKRKKEEGIDLFKKKDWKKLFKNSIKRSETNWYPILCVGGSGWFVYYLFFSPCPFSYFWLIGALIIFIITFFVVKHKVKYEIKKRKRLNKKWN